MATVLYIKANPKPVEESRSLQIAEEFIAAYKREHPDHEIVTLDLYREGIRFLTAEDIRYHNLEALKDSAAAHNHPILKYAFQFAAADKYVIAEPLWNLGVPAILKAYIDYVAVSGITFKYTDDAVIGLCHGKKALNITTRGGDYTHGEMAAWEMCDKYLRAVLGFFGITDYTTLAVDNLDIVGQDVEAIMNRAINRARELAKVF